MNLVSIPTAGTMPKGAFTLEMLLQNNGGLLPKLAVGLTPNFTIGMSYGVQNFIGNDKPIVNREYPEMQIKYRVYDETIAFPAIVIGLDSQGKGSYNIDGVVNDTLINIERYDQKAWGVYAVASKNWNLLGNLGIHIGFSKNSRENKDGDDDINFFCGIDKELNRSFSLLLEYDSALNDNKDMYELNGISIGKGYGYLNAGVRWTIAPNLLIEINFNDISKNTDAKFANREVKIMYSETF